MPAILIIDAPKFIKCRSPMNYMNKNIKQSSKTYKQRYVFT